MLCPYCEETMRKGTVESMHVPLLWCSNEGMPRKTVRLSENGGLFGGDADAWYCENCCVVLLPVPEQKRTIDKLKRKITEKSSKL